MNKEQMVATIGIIFVVCVSIVQLNTTDGLMFLMLIPLLVKSESHNHFITSPHELLEAFGIQTEVNEETPQEYHETKSELQL